MDVAIRYSPAQLAGGGATKLGGEAVFPVCSPSLLLDRSRPLNNPTDLERHVLLTLDDPDGRWPWLSWNVWLEVAGIPELRPGGILRLSGYEQVIPAAIAGNGVALGRSPLVDAAIRDGQLVAPLERIASTERAYWIVTGPEATSRPHVAEFVAWLKRASAKDLSRSNAGTR